MTKRHNSVSKHWTVFWNGHASLFFIVFKQTIQFLQQQINAKKSIKYPVLGFQPTTSCHESSPVTTRPGLPPCIEIIYPLKLSSVFCQSVGLKIVVPISVIRLGYFYRSWWQFCYKRSPIIVWPLGLFLSKINWVNLLSNFWQKLGLVLFKRIVKFALFVIVYFRN